MKKILTIFICLLVLISFVGCGSKNDVQEIQKEINSLKRINNNEKKIVKAMTIEKKIKMLSEEDKNNVSNMDIFIEEKHKASIKVKESLLWNQSINTNEDFVMFDEIFDYNNENIELVDVWSSLSTTWIIEKDKEKNKILKLIDVPYISVSSISEIKDSNPDKSHLFMFEIENSLKKISILVYFDGRIVIIGEGTCHVSLVKTNYNYFKKNYFNKYDTYVLKKYHEEFGY